MKLQYFGDSKDAFKYDYHVFLLNFLRLTRLTIIPMLTRDDSGNDGKTDATRYEARKGIYDFCAYLRKNRNIESLTKLPFFTGSEFEVVLHNPTIYLDGSNRHEYFKQVQSTQLQLVLIDPDNGFEPKRSSEKHLRFLELKQILDQLPNRSIVSIFQHFRRIPFSTDYLTIRENLPNLTTAAIHSSSLMFVAVSKSAKAIEAVAHANDLYSESHPVVALK